MSLFDWFADRRRSAPISKEQQQREIADGLWTKCAKCLVLAYAKDLSLNQMVCPECGHHMPVTVEQRINQLADTGTWVPLDESLVAGDPLEFRDRKSYRDRLRETREKTGLKDGVQTGLGKLEGYPFALGVMDFRFMGGSMGSVVGEKLTRLAERATAEHIPLIFICASGGARMQEGMLSLMQMAKVSAALERHREAQLLYIPILTHPTTGGVTASFAMLGDICLAEPKALIGFTGRRVIEQTLRQKVPEDFQTAEYQLAHGLVDAIVPRPQLRKVLAQLLALHQPVVRPTQASPVLLREPVTQPDWTNQIEAR
ncbi:acetyl-CoA carboxylase, carboxyltransferase subunit beta [Leptolyngbya sp. FACHB-261]|uniref:acetyl-CoA carboxylase, carboxyltransferase subunit beta n=1 Tax=Leptolyngbya sp. FACHB-261 TaxID=2692806 RepID=UPI001685B922|nr:acetyl-CoA carboxylase, carboxyltransferase subunit beta [Leptolyngbya sp. FACHB-261]MBD2103461.1 acetyl-CoA carboxylase carboxyltransferase subunit beta [Leptolyngbya sp. FACHB-261]